MRGQIADRKSTLKFALTLVGLTALALAISAGVICFFLSRSAPPAKHPEIFFQFGHSSFVKAIALSPDGQTLASGSDDKTIKLWDMRNGQLLRTLDGHQE